MVCRHSDVYNDLFKCYDRLKVVHSGEFICNVKGFEDTHYWILEVVDEPIIQ